jgi:hypothetical protein
MLGWIYKHGIIVSVPILGVKGVNININRLYEFS